MALNMGAFLPWILKMVINPLVWLIILVGMIGFIFMFLKIRRKRRMKFEGIEMVDLGKGHYGFNVVPCGWIGIKLWFRGLWWTGREVMRTTDNEIIMQFSEEDFQEVNGKRGIIFARDPVSRMLFPINKIRMENKELMATIPPAEYIDEAIAIVKDAEKETTDWKQKAIMWAVMGGIVIFALIAIIVITQMVKNGQKEAADLITSAGKTCLENAQTVCAQVCSAKGGAP